MGCNACATTRRMRGLGKCPRERPVATWAIDPPAFGRAYGFVQKPRPVVPAQPPSRICHGKFSRRHDYCLGWVRRVSSCFRIGNQLFAKTLGAGKSGTGWATPDGEFMWREGQGWETSSRTGSGSNSKNTQGQHKCSARFSSQTSNREGWVGWGESRWTSHSLGSERGRGAPRLSSPAPLAHRPHILGRSGARARQGADRLGPGKMGRKARPQLTTGTWPGAAHPRTAAPRGPRSGPAPSRGPGCLCVVCEKRERE